MATKDASVHPTTLGRLDSPQSHAFEKPSKRINEDDQKKEEDTPAIQDLENLLESLQVAVQEVPPDPGPRRFGNLAFRKWFSLVESQSREKVAALVPDLPATAVDEIQAYLLGSFGSAQRLDYGTGHELSFLAFLGCLWKVGFFSASKSHNLERQIVLEVFKPYLDLVRRLILTYNLEPAGSHGVWGLDDHAFLPYIFGSAELSPSLGPELKIPAEGSAQGAPNPADVTKSTVVERERAGNLYFGAIGFINDVKKGPFWEHSPMLYDISGVQAGWAKINKGMIKMYNAEVLSKFPVVQHFPFGSLFRWEADPTAVAPTTSTHVSSQPTFASQTSSRTHAPARAPLSSTTAAPWADSPSARTTEPGLSRPDLNMNARAPWAAGNSAPQSASSASLNPSMAPTRAPWAKK